MLKLKISPFILIGFSECPHIAIPQLAFSALPTYIALKKSDNYNRYTYIQPSVCFLCVISPGITSSIKQRRFWQQRDGQLQTKTTGCFLRTRRTINALLEPLRGKKKASTKISLPEINRHDEISPPSLACFLSVGANCASVFQHTIG